MCGRLNYSSLAKSALAFLNCLSLSPTAAHYKTLTIPSALLSKQNSTMSLSPTTQNEEQQPSNNGLLPSSVASSLDYEELGTSCDVEGERVFVSSSSTTNLWSTTTQPPLLENNGDDKWGPLPYNNNGSSESSAYGFIRHNYIDSIRTWSSSGGYGFGGLSSVGGGVSVPPPPPPSTAATAVIVAPPLLNNMEVDDPLDIQPPRMVRAESDSDTSESTSGDDDDDEETMSDAGSSLASDDDDDALIKDNNNNANNNNNHNQPVVLTKGVSFNEQVRVLPIPPIASYTPEQRYKMYANRFELRENKTRNKKEYEFDNYDWRNATEEHCMAICPLSGELLHPAHL